MTEEEWLTTNDSRAMLAFARTARERKARLLAVACCRRIEHLVLRCKGAYRALIVAEFLADGLPFPEDVRAYRNRVAETAFWWVDCHKPEREPNFVYYAGSAAAATLADFNSPGIPAMNLMNPFSFGDMKTLDGCLESAAYAVAHWNRRTDQEPPNRADIAREHAEQTPLVRDIFGNPFRPVAFDPAWRTDTAVALARQMYDSRDFGTMPILADALQDAGCEHEQVLNHCRDATAPHVRGCWVVDLVLAK